MAKVVEDRWPGNLAGLVVTRYGHGVSCRQIEVVEAGHPTPDEAGLGAARRILDSVANLTTDDLVLALISGGGSALLTLPAAGISLAEKRALTAALLKSGAPIAEINCVRKHLSAIKGGRLTLAAVPAPVAALIISDVPGDDPALVASGPTVPDPTTSAEAAGILHDRGIAASEPVAAWLKNPESETPKPGDPAFSRVHNKIIASSRAAIAESARMAGAFRYLVRNLGDLEGEARNLARDHAQMALQLKREGKAAVILSGGETTVTVRGDGRGGRNTEYLLALAGALDGADGVWALACDTDGIDGTEDNAGAIIAPDTVRRAATLGLSVDGALAQNDSYGFFAGVGDLIVTGPTRTNVNDFRAILIAGSRQK